MRGCVIRLLRAGDGIRTHDNDVGNVVLYQLSYTRLAGIGVIRHPQAGSRSPSLG